MTFPYSFWLNAQEAKQDRGLVDSSALSYQSYSNDHFQHDGFSEIIVPSFCGSRRGSWTGSEFVWDPFGTWVWDRYGTYSSAVTRPPVFFRSRGWLKGGGATAPAPFPTVPTGGGVWGPWAEPAQEIFNYVPIGYHYLRFRTVLHRFRTVLHRFGPFRIVFRSFRPNVAKSLRKLATNLRKVRRNSRIACF